MYGSRTFSSNTALFVAYRIVTLCDLFSLFAKIIVSPLSAVVTILLNLSSSIFIVLVVACAGISALENKARKIAAIAPLITKPRNFMGSVLSGNIIIMI
jgi:magnesium-transporting ATPase (P-type)